MKIYCKGAACQTLLKEGEHKVRPYLKFLNYLSSQVSRKLRCEPLMKWT